MNVPGWVDFRVGQSSGIYTYSEASSCCVQLELTSNVILWTSGIFKKQGKFQRLKKKKQEPGVKTVRSPVSDLGIGCLCFLSLDAVAPSALYVGNSSCHESLHGRQHPEGRLLLAF